MFEPIREVMTTSPEALVEDSVVLGEQACQLFGGRDEVEFVSRGGALYDTVALANVGVLGPSSAAEDDEASDPDGKTDALYGSSSGSGSSSRPLGIASRKQGRPTQGSSMWYAQGQGRRRRAPHAPHAPLLMLVTRVFYFPLHVAMWVLTVAAYILPWLRVIFPFAVPSRASGLAAAMSAGTAGSGPEKVVAIAFHPSLPLLAAAVAEGGPSGRTRIVLYDVAQEKLVSALTHAFQRDVETLAWKPRAKDVLLVGCSGGLLVWQLTAAETPAQGQSRQRAGTGSGAARPTLSAGVDVDKTAQCLFYACARHVPVTCIGTSWVDGRYVACGSRSHTYLHLLDLCASPVSPDCLVSHRAITVDGGLATVRFAEDDSFLIAAVHAHPSLALMRLGQQVDSSTVHVDTPAPVHQMEPVSGIPHMHYYALTTEGLEGALIARISPFVGVEVVSVVSTGMFRGVGGSVRCLAASHSRLYLSVETGHVVVCRYGFRDQKVTVMPIGVAALAATQLCCFTGFTQGSLLAAVERGELLSLIPSYHT